MRRGRAIGRGASLFAAHRDLAALVNGASVNAPTACSVVAGSPLWRPESVR
jgi:hypothetical protein